MTFLPNSHYTDFPHPTQKNQTISTKYPTTQTGTLLVDPQTSTQVRTRERGSDGAWFRQLAHAVV